ncbi:MAG: molecular chaperone HtpG, partial [Campylobacterales bacterium]
MAKHQFNAEINQLLHLMINSLYSNKEIFLRELVSNSSDAIDKLKYLTITNDDFKSLEFSPKITIKIDKEAKTLTLSDNGIGMNEEDLVEHLGTIAKSGTKSFVEKLSGDAKKDSNLIGQFGVGFYSAFMVSSKIEVVAKKAGEEKAYRWISAGKGEYEIEEAMKESQGVDVIMHIRDEDSEFLEGYRIESIIKKYSNHIPFPIYKESFDEEKKEVKEEQINKASALWRVSKSELKDEDYKEFYKTISHDSDEPLHWLHTRVEGSFEYTTLFYIPKHAPFDMFRMDYQPGVKLYIKRVFITDDEKELMPTYLRFLRGVIDSEDLPLNVSREILQHNRLLAKIKQTSVKKVLTELEKMAENDKEKYKEFYKEFGKVLKEGLYTDFENKDTILNLARFKSTKSDEPISLKEYKENMKEDQKAIYYILGEDADALKHSPLIEGFKKKGIEVLLMDDEIDSVSLPMIDEYDGVKLQNISSTSADDDIEKVATEDEEKFKPIVEKIKETLKDRVKEVKLTKRLSESPSCIVLDENDPDFSMQRLMEQMGQAANMPPVKPILEINPDHEIFGKLLLSQDDSMIEDISHLLLDEAKLPEGQKIDSMAEFIKRVN